MVPYYKFISATTKISPEKVPHHGFLQDSIASSPPWAISYTLWMPVPLTGNGPEVKPRVEEDGQKNQLHQAGSKAN